MSRIGIFVCHCGSNIASGVHIEQVVEAAKEFPNVAYVEANKYTCSEPGQAKLKAAIIEHRLDRIVCCTCSPRMHESTFRKMLKSTTINSYMLEVANLREQCSWVHTDKDKATEKAITLVRMAAAKVNHNNPLFPSKIKVTKRALVIGAGIAGMQAALDIADAGHQVTLVEREPSIGGKMVMLDKTFPTMDCSACISTPKMVECSSHPNITIMTSAEVEKVDGYLGNFQATIRQKARYVDHSLCKGCSDCMDACPVQGKNNFDLGLGKRKAIYTLFPQAVPNKAVIEKKGASPCKFNCPAHLDAHGYIALTGVGRYEEALGVVRRTTPFAGVLGRVCFHPCEENCSRGKADQPLAIATLKRFLADKARENGNLAQIAVTAEPKNEKVAVIGSGPAGLNCAYMLALEGYKVTVFEALPVPGGMLKVGIPDYRLDKTVLAEEIKLIEDMGVEILCNTRIGKDMSLKKLRSKGYKAFFIAIGAHTDSKLNVPGEDAQGVVAGVDFLRESNLGIDPKPGKRVIVVGGGNVAMDAARTALRLGCDVTVLYRRSEAEMPANALEIEHAREEGVKFEFLSAPVEIISQDGILTGVKSIRNRLGEPDAKGRRSPVAIDGSEFILGVDTIIKAIGQKVVQEDLTAAGFSLFDRWGNVAANAETKTELVDVFAGGDALTGPATVIEAIAAGNKAAKAIMNYLEGTDVSIEPFLLPEATVEVAELKDVPRSNRAKMPMIAISERRSTFKEAELGFDEKAAVAEALRCVNCAVCSECRACETACQSKAILREQQDELVVEDFGAIVVTTGYELIDWASLYGEYGGGRYPDVITGLQFERLVNASGPTEGHILRPSDNTEPKDVVIIKCVGSRDENKGKAYCSRACCMYGAKHAHQVLDKIPGSRCFVFYMDVRTAGKGYEEFYARTREDGALYLRGRVAKIYREGGKLICKGEDSLIGKPVTVKADMVILETAMVPSPGVVKLAGILGISTDPDKWLNEAHPKLRPVETNSAGIYLAGTCQGPKDIPDTVAQASAAAAKVSALFSNDELETNPMISKVVDEKCSGCGLCVGCCPYTAITLQEIEERVGALRLKRTVASVNNALCQGCGACAGACRPGAIDLQGFSNRQLLEEVDALCL